MGLKFQNNSTRSGIMSGHTYLRYMPAAHLLLGLCFASALSGCWTAPVAEVQPKGKARVIQLAIPVEVVKEDATLHAVDADQGLIVLDFTDGTSATVKPAPGVIDFSRIRPGDKAKKAKVVQELSVYVLIDGMLTGVDGQPEPIKTDARVLEIDRAYRLLSLKYPNGHVEVLKVGLDAKLADMEAGNSVAIKTTELRALKVRKH
jgi:hypothetical protein